MRTTYRLAAVRRPRARPRRPRSSAGWQAPGAISLGKTNTPEFGAGSHTVNRVFGATRNPYDLGRSAGGSSGGAAAALAARMIALADGSDLGGSLRNPASFCNVVGLRPSPGRVPSWPVTDVADWLGVDGPMARTVADVALLLAVLSGPDPRVPLALDAPPPALSDPAQVTALLDARPARGPGGLEPRPRTARRSRGARCARSGQAGAGRPWLRGRRREPGPVRCGRGIPDLAGAAVRDRVRRRCMAEHPGRLGPNVAWNVQRGLELTAADLSRATRLLAALAERQSASSSRPSTCSPARSARCRRSTSTWTGCTRSTACRWTRTWTGWRSAYLISATGLPGHLGSRRIHSRARR